MFWILKYMIIYRYTTYNLIFYYWVLYIQDPLHDTDDFMLTFNFKFYFRCYFITPIPMKNIHISSVFHISDSSVKNIHAVFDSIQIVTDKNAVWNSVCHLG